MKIITNLKLLIILLILLAIATSLSATQVKPAKKSPVSNTLNYGGRYVIMPWDVKQAMKENKKIILVDVRDNGSYQKVHIPGSINIPLYAIGTKPYLKKDQIILVNEGYQIKEASLTCSKLRQDGFNSMIMHGGLSSWVRLKYPIIGDPFVADEFNMVPSQVFYREKEFGNWLVVDISKTGSGSRYFPKAVKFPVRDFKKDLPGLVTVIRKNAYKPYQLILIVSDDGSDYDAIEKSLILPKDKDIFFLKGGTKEYAAFLRDKTAANKSYEERKVVTQGCPSCTKKNPQNNSRGLK